MTLLDKELFVLESPQSTQLDVYDANDYTSRGNIAIPQQLQSNFVDIAACSFYRCIYIADVNNTRIVKLKLPSHTTTWKVDDINYNTVVSITSSHYLLILCKAKVSNKLKLFSMDGELQKTVELQLDTAPLNSAVEQVPGQYVATYGTSSGHLHRVCVVNDDGKVLHAHGGFQGSYGTLMNSPGDVVIDKDGFVYVFGERNKCLIVLTPELDYIHSIAFSVPSVEGCTTRDIQSLKIDEELRHIYLRYSIQNRCWQKFYRITFFTLCL